MCFDTMRTHVCNVTCLHAIVIGDRICSAPDLAACLRKPLALLSARLSESCLVSLVRGTSRPSKGNAPVKARCTVAAKGEARSDCS